MELREIQRKLGVTTIFVTHDRSEALSLSDRISVMLEGRIARSARRRKFIKDPASVFASFVGDANVLRGRLERIAGSNAIVALGAIIGQCPGRPTGGAFASRAGRPVRST